MADIPKPHPREVEDGYELFEATPEGVVRWVRSTRPRVPPEDVAAHVAHLVELGRLTPRDVAAIHAELPDVAAASA